MTEATLEGALGTSLIIRGKVKSKNKIKKIKEYNEHGKKKEKKTTGVAT